MKKLKTDEAPPGEAKFKDEAGHSLQDASTSSDAILASATANLIDDPSSGSKKRKQEDLNTSNSSEGATAVNSETPGVVKSETPNSDSSVVPTPINSVVPTAANSAVPATVYTFVHVEINSVFLSSESSSSSWEAFDIEWDDLDDSLEEEARLRTEAWVQSHCLSHSYNPQSRYPSDAKYVRTYLFEMQWPTQDDEPDDEEYLLGEMLGEERDKHHGWLHFAARLRSWAHPWIKFEDTMDGNGVATHALVPKQIGKIFCVSDDEEDPATLVNAKEFWDAETWGKALGEVVDELRAFTGSHPVHHMIQSLHRIVYLVFTEDEANVEKKAQK